MAKKDKHDRTRRFDMRISDEELDWLEQLAYRAGISKSDYLRGHIRREAKRRKLKC